MTVEGSNIQRNRQRTLCIAESFFVIRFKTRDLILATLLPIGVFTVPQTKDPLFCSGGGIFSFGALAVLTLRFRSCDDTYSRKFTIAVMMHASFPFGRSSLESGTICTEKLGASDGRCSVLIFECANSFHFHFHSQKKNPLMNDR